MRKNLSACTRLRANGSVADRASSCPADWMRQRTPHKTKAAIMQKKHAAIVDAARTAFLESSYAETSMDSIAKAAKVGIKTVYRHIRLRSPFRLRGKPT